MTRRLDESRVRLDELLADRATTGLGEAELDELEALLRLHPGVDADALDRAAAMLDVTWVGTTEVPLPPALRQSILESWPMPS